MGRGNFYQEGARTVYVDVPQDRDEYEDFEEVIHECLPESFYRCREYQRDINGYSLARNKLLVCFLTDNEWSIAVNLMPHPETEHPELAKAQLIRVADAFFDRLSDHYQLSVRTSAWTSAPRDLPNPPTPRK